MWSGQNENHVLGWADQLDKLSLFSIVMRQSSQKLTDHSEVPQYPTKIMS